MNSVLLIAHISEHNRLHSSKIISKEKTKKKKKQDLYVGFAVPVDGERVKKIKF